MKFVVVGSNGRSGINFVQQALDDGHHVTALVRDPTKITIENENLTVCYLFFKLRIFYRFEICSTIEVFSTIGS